MYSFENNFKANQTTLEFLCVQPLSSIFNYFSEEFRQKALPRNVAWREVGGEFFEKCETSVQGMNALKFALKLTVNRKCYKPF